MPEGWHRKHTRGVKRGWVGSVGKTVSRLIRVAFRENRRSDKTGHERGTGGRNKEIWNVVDRLVYGVG